MVWSKVEMIFLRQLGTKAAHYCTSPWLTWYYLHNPPLFTHPQMLHLLLGELGRFPNLGSACTYGDGSGIGDKTAKICMSGPVHVNLH